MAQPQVLVVSPATFLTSPSLPKICGEVGAGPSGLLLALSLLKNGVPVRIIEKEEDNNVGDRGAGIMVRFIPFTSCRWLMHTSTPSLHRLQPRTIEIPRTHTRS